MTYALRTRGYTEKELKKQGQFQFKCLRQIQNPQWILQEHKPARDQLNLKYKQPTIQTWIQKLAVTQHLHQTTRNWNIHNMTQYQVKQIAGKWQQHWALRKKLHTRNQHTRTKRTPTSAHIHAISGKKEK